MTGGRFHAGNHYVSLSITSDYTYGTEVHRYLRVSGGKVTPPYGLVWRDYELPHLMVRGGEITDSPTSRSGVERLLTPPPHGPGWRDY